MNLLTHISITIFNLLNRKTNPRKACKSGLEQRESHPPLSSKAALSQQGLHSP